MQELAVFIYSTSLVPRLPFSIKGLGTRLLQYMHVLGDVIYYRDWKRITCAHNDMWNRLYH